MIAALSVRVLIVALALAWHTSVLALGASLKTEPKASQLLSVGWSAPLKISGETGGWFPDVTADLSGNVHVVWNSGFADTEQWAEGTVRGSLRNTHQVGALYYARSDGHDWTPPNDIALISQGWALRSSIVADRTGRIHLTHNGFGTVAPEQVDYRTPLGSQGLWYTAFDVASRLSVQSHKPPTRISRYASGYFSDLAVDSRGVIHAIWTESVAGSWSIYYARSADQGQTWSNRVALEDRNLHWYRAQLKIDTRDRLHVVWELLDPNAPQYQIADSRYAVSSDGGSTWSKVRFPEQQPGVGIDGQGTILLVFRDPRSDRILYRLSTDGASWSSPAAVPGIGLGVPRPYDVYDTATDSAGNVHLAVVANRPGTESMALLHLGWDGRQWGPPNVIAASPHFPEYPRLAIVDGNRLHVVWFDGDGPSVDRSPTGIWYSTARSAAPGVPTAARKTEDTGVQSTAASSPRPSSTPESSPEPIARGGGSERDATRTTVMEYRPEIPIIFGLAPVLLLLAGIFIVVAGPRRPPR